MSIDGTDFADTLSGTLDDDVINAGDGNDTINASQGADSVDGGTGTDRLTFTLASASWFDSALAARSFTIGGNSVTDGGSINTGFTNVENITFSTVGAGDFDDTIDASGFLGSTLTILLGDGNASVTGSIRNDIITTGRGDNVVSAGQGTDTINASQGHDTIDGGSSGSAGDQLVMLMSSASRFDSATGARTYTITSSHAGDSSGTLDTDFTSIERFTLSTTGTGDFNDAIDASGIVSSSTGIVFSLSAGAGNDTVTGSNYADNINVGRGSNTVDAGGGSDTVRFNYDSGAGGTMFITGSGNSLQTSYNGETNTALNAEDVYLINDNQTAGMTIDASGYTGGARLALINSNGGSDIFIGHNGVDIFGTNYLAQVGGDTYTGNGGADIYDYLSSVSAMNGDIITDFDSDDIIDLTFNTPASNSGGFLAYQFIGNAAFSGVAGQYRYFGSGGQTFVEADTNGDGVADQTLTIANGQFALGETSAGSNILHIVGQFVTGTSGGDLNLRGTLGNDLIYGFDQPDRIYASQGTDFIDGGTFNDRLTITTADTTLFAAQTAARTYTITSTSATDSSGTLNTTMTSIERLTFSNQGAGDFDDTIDVSGFISSAPSGIVTLQLGNGNNTVVGSNYGDLISVGSGHNVIDGGAGIDTVAVLIDNNSNDTLFVSAVGSTITTMLNGVVTNTINDAEFFTIRFSDYASTAVTQIDASGVAFGALSQLGFDDHNGSDILIGSHGTDFFANGPTNTIGNDIYTGNGGADIFDYTFAIGAMDGDTITDLDSDDVIDLQHNTSVAGDNFGGLLADQFIGNAAFTGVAGQYRYFSSGGQTVVEADTNGDGVADETLTIANGAFALGETFAGSNILHIIGSSGTSGADTLTGTLGDDSIFAQGGNDVINGSQGSDFINGGNGGGDRLFMNTGDGSLFTLATDGRTYTIGASTITDSSGTLNTSFTQVERIAFSTVGNGDFDDVVDASGFVSAATTALDIRLGNGDNIVTGSSGEDRVFGGFGNNIADGGAGYDRGFISVDTTSDATVVITSVGGSAVTTANGVTNSFSNFEEMQVFGVGSAKLTLDASGFNAVPGTQLILTGHNGSDTMIGSLGDDFFANVTGQVLGNDIYTGHGGADIYDYTWAADSMNGDTITDFDIDDVIDFRFNNHEQGGSPVLANHFIGANEFSGTAGEYRYQIDGTTTVVQVDSDGDTVVDQTLTISNGGFELAETFAGSNILTLAAVINPLDGIVADGYLAGATLFIDVNGNKQLDGGEAWTVTDANGNFTLNVNQAGTMVAIGGTNADTGLANTMTLMAPSDSGVVNPLTTLVQAVVEASGGATTADQAVDQVLAALGLDPGLDLLNLDLLGQGSDPAALEAQKAAAMIANLVSSAEGAAGAGAGTESALVGALADLVADTGPGETVDLTDTATLTPLLTEALPGVTNVSNIVNEVAAESETIAAATSIDGISDAQLDATLIDYSLNNDIVGDAGANHLFGFGGNDKLSGLGGNDILEGGSGFDFLWGGSGNDIFVAENSAAKEQTKVGALSLDVVFDFAAGDKIDLRDIDANAALSGDQVFNFRGTNANKLAGDLSYKVFDSVMGAEKALGHDIDGVTGASPYSGPVTIVYGNVDGGTADFAIALIGVNGVKASDFLFA
jgi:Ca2+-binding RTX toxin-like protein